jgi:hypothetical protein
MSSSVSSKIADGGWITGLVVWYVSHIAQINEVLQHVILILTAVSLLAAIRYHWKKANAK